MKIGKEDALIIIDPQRDFVYPDGALFVKGISLDFSIEEVIANIVLLCDMPFGYKAITMDKHPEIHYEHTMFPKHCIAGTNGQYMIDEVAHAMNLWSIYEPIAPDILYKGSEANIVAFSVAFSPLFDAHLYAMRLKGIKRVFLAGWAFDFCVGESSIAYKVQGFDSFVVVDATRSVGELTAQQMDHKLVAYDVSIVLMGDFLN